jgi:hypothetical protein
MAPLQKAGRDVVPEREAKAKGRKLPKFYSDTSSCQLLTKKNFNTC